MQKSQSGNKAQRRQYNERETTMTEMYEGQNDKEVAVKRWVAT